MLWETLDECWKEVFRLSWESYKNGTIPVGAIILDENNDIVAKGRNVSYDKESEHILAGTTIGHAEMVALMQLKKSEHPNIKKYRLYVSLEPCPMCFGAIMMSGIKDVYFAASDVAAGSSVMQDITEYIESRSIKVVKDTGNLEIFQIVLQTARGKFNPTKKTIDSWNGEHPGVVELGFKLHDEKYFETVAKENLEISDVYNYVISRYNSLRGNDEISKVL